MSASPTIPSPMTTSLAILSRLHKITFISKLGLLNFSTSCHICPFYKLFPILVCLRCSPIMHITYGSPWKNMCCLLTPTLVDIGFTIKLISYLIILNFMAVFQKLYHLTISNLRFILFLIFLNTLIKLLLLFAIYYFKNYFIN
jgi:hypothetical protein